MPETDTPTLEELAEQVKALTEALMSLGSSRPAQAAPQAAGAAQGVTFVPWPALAVSGTTAAVTTPRAASVSQLVPPGARAVLLAVTIRVASGGGGMKFWGVTSAGGGFAVCAGISGADGFHQSGFALVPVVNGVFRYMVTDEAGGGTVTNWQDYNAWVVGWV